MSIVERIVKRVKEIKDDIALWLEWHIFGCVRIPSLSDEESKDLEETKPDYTYIDENGMDVPVFILKY